MLNFLIGEIRLNQLIFKDLIEPLFLLQRMTGRKNRALQVPPVIPYKALGKCHVTSLFLSLLIYRRALAAKNN